MVKILTICGTLISLLFFSHDYLLACSCVSQPISRSYRSADVIFVGTIKSELESPLSHWGRYYSFNVKKVIKGEWRDTIVIKTGMGGGDCGYFFHDSLEYLVYAYKTDTIFSTNICTRTQPYRYAKVDQTFFQNLPQILSTTSLMGTILYSRDENPYTILSSLTITIKNDQFSYTAITDIGGMFFFNNINPGLYTVKFDINDSLYISPYLTDIRIDSAESVEETFVLHPNTIISGELVFPDGKKGKDIDVSLVPADLRGRRSSLGYFDWTSSNDTGYFEFDRGIKLGEYYLTLNPNGPSVKQPYPTLYYPGVSSISKAEKIVINSAITSKKISFVLPSKKIPIFVISGQCYYKNNLPAKNITITFSTDKGYRRTDWFNIETNRYGKFSFKAVQNQKIWVSNYNFKLKVSEAAEKELISKRKPISREFGTFVWNADTLSITKSIPDLKLTINYTSNEVSSKLKKMEEENEKNRH